MSSILNISENALQEVIEQIDHNYLLSKPLLCTSVQRILHQHCGDVDDSFVSEIARVAAENNVFLKFTSTGGSLSTANKRTSYISREFSVVMPVEFVLKKQKADSCVCPHTKNAADIAKQWRHFV